MGFSLEEHFRYLALLLSKDMPDNEKLVFINKKIKDDYQYAIDCRLVEHPHMTFMPELIGKDFTIFDTETTGFMKDDEIVQLGAVNRHGGGVFNQLIKATKESPQGALDIHGITFELCQKKGVEWADSFELFCRVVNGKPLVAYNLNFDLRMLEQTCKIHGVDFSEFKPSSVHCAMLAYAEYFGEVKPNGDYKWQKLVLAAEQQGVEIIGAHDAIGDCVMTHRVMEAVWENQKKTPLF